MKTIRVILHDQLNFSISSLKNFDQHNDIILMLEVEEEFSYVKHHKKKIAFILSAMRHFAQELQNKNFPLIYVKLDDKENKGSILEEIIRLYNKIEINKIIVTYPSEYRVLEQFKKLREKILIPVEIIDDDRFLVSNKDFKKWASDKKGLLLENFYRFMRKKHNILLQNNEPIGGEWNYDKENRKFPAKQNMPKIEIYKNPLDNITEEVLSLVSNRYNSHFGDLHPFNFAVTREQALAALNYFIKYRLQYFGDYQDAMIEDEPWMYHSLLSFYLNIGLLLPIECIKAAEEAYYHGNAPLNSVEGFIRQILGWREYIKGVYWLFMPEYKSLNFFNAKRNLPEFYWSGNTEMNCIKQCVKTTKENAYAHHIQRLMVLGNFALIAGINPDHVNEWFLIVYADAYEWVELPNVTGMILFADGGKLSSKPYAASGAYINKMSDYCKNCSYNVNKKNGPDACPFNYLYWDFLLRNKNKLQDNKRLKMIYSTLSKMSLERIKQIEADSKAFLKYLNDVYSY